MKKLSLTVLAVICTVCMAFCVCLYTNTQKANADTLGTEPTLSATKVMVSKNADKMLLATAIKDYDDVYEVGYNFTGSVTPTKNETKKYYTSITSGGNTLTPADIFSESWASQSGVGMIIWEIPFSVGTAYEFKPYAIYGDRNDQGGLIASNYVETPATSVSKQFFTVTLEVDGTNSYGSLDGEELLVPSGSSISVNNNVLTIAGINVTATADAETDDYEYELGSFDYTGSTVSDNMTVTANFNKLTKYDFNGTVSMKRNAETSYIDAGTTVNLYKGNTLYKSATVGADGAFDFGKVAERTYSLRGDEIQNTAITIDGDASSEAVTAEYDFFTAVSTFDSSSANDGTVEMTGTGGQLAFNHTSDDFYFEFIYKMRDTDTTGENKDARFYLRFNDGLGGHYGVRITESADNANSIAFAEWADEYSLSWSGYNFSDDEKTRIKGDGLKIAIVRYDGVMYVYTENTANGLMAYRLRATAKNANDDYVLSGWQVYQIEDVRYLENYDAVAIKTLAKVADGYLYAPDYNQIKSDTSIVFRGSAYRNFINQYENFEMEFDFKLTTPLKSNATNRFRLAFNHNGKYYYIQSTEWYDSGEDATSPNYGRFSRIDFEDNSSGAKSGTPTTRYTFSDAEKEASRPVTGTGVHFKIQRLNGVLKLWVNDTLRLTITLNDGYGSDAISFIGAAQNCELKNFTYVELA